MNLLFITGAGFAMLFAVLIVAFAIGLMQWARQPRERARGGHRLKSRRSLWQCVSEVFVLGVMEALILPRKFWRLITPPKRRLVGLANVAEGTRAGAITKLADAAITARFLLAKFGSDVSHADIATSTDIPIGVFTDEAAAADDLVNVNLLGSNKSTQKGVASGTVTQGDFIVPDDGGTVRKLPTGAGTYYIVGRALTTVATGLVVEFDPCIPVQRVVA